jgi:hypothetical protein
LSRIDISKILTIQDKGVESSARILPGSFYTKPNKMMLSSLFCSHNTGYPGEPGQIPVPPELERRPAGYDAFKHNNPTVTKAKNWS